MSEIDYALRQERLWRNLCRTGGMDSGSYCESAGPDYTSAQKVRSAYQTLADALLAHERSGYKMPVNPAAS